jgi:hypothetical protein
MNEELFKYAMDLVDTMSLSELEEKLLAFGFDCQRKVSLYSEQELSPSMSAESVSGTARESVDFSINYSLPSLDFMAANDNSYALAA